MCIELAGKSRTGPSLCFQDYYIAPVYALAVGLLLARRAKTLNGIPPAENPQQYWVKADFGLVALSILHSAYGMMMVEGGGSAEDSTVWQPPSHCMQTCSSTRVASLIACSALFWGAMVII
jgi:hypothetical protein